MKLFGRKPREEDPRPDPSPGPDDGFVMPEDADLLVSGPEEEPTPKGFLARIFSRKSASDPALVPEDATSGDQVDEGEVVTGGLKRVFSRSKPKPSQAASEIDAGGLEKIIGGEVPDYEYDNNHALKISGKTVVLGMLWDSLQSGQKIKEKAIDISPEDVEFDLATIFRDVDQVGFAEGTRNIKPGSRAGVTAFREARMGASWVAAFRLNPSGNAWWVAARRNGQVYEDQVFRDEEEARAIFLENLQAPDWQRRIAPGEWDIGGTEEFGLQDVIEPAVGLSLKPVRPLRTYLPRIIVAGVLLVVGIGGYFYYQDYQDTLEEREAELARQREQQVRVSPSDYPWFDAPDVPLFFSKCIPRMETAIRNVPGWSQDLVSCRLDLESKEAVVQTSWSNSSGTIPWMIAAFRPDEVTPVIDRSGASASYETRIDFGVETETLAEAFEADRIQRLLDRRIQTTGVNVTASPVVQRVTPEMRAQMRSPVFNYHELSFQTSTGLEDYARLFSDMPATVPTDLVYELGSGTWNVTFHIYHPAIEPI